MPTHVADLLTEYYGLPKSNETAIDSKVPDNVPCRIPENTDEGMPQRNAQATWKYMLATMSLEQLLAEATKAGNAVRSSERELQMLLYDNYRNLFTAMSGLTLMVEEAANVEVKVTNAANAMNQVTNLQAKLQPAMGPALDTLQSAVRRQRTCQKLTELAALPRKVQSLLATGNNKEALETVMGVAVLFKLEEQSDTLMQFLSVVKGLGRESALGMIKELGEQFNEESTAALIEDCLRTPRHTDRFGKAFLKDIGWPSHFISVEMVQSIRDRLMLLSQSQPHLDMEDFALPSIKALTSAYESLFVTVMDVLLSHKELFEGDGLYTLAIFCGACSSAAKDISTLKQTVRECLSSDGLDDPLTTLEDQAFFVIKDHVRKFVYDVSLDQALVIANELQSVYEMQNLVGATILAKQWSALLTAPFDDLKEIAKDRASDEVRDTLCSKLMQCVSDGLQSTINSATKVRQKVSDIQEIVNWSFVLTSVVPLTLSVQSRAIYESTTCQELAKSRAVTERVIDFVETKSIVLNQLALESILGLLQETNTNLIDDETPPPDTYTYCLLNLSDCYLNRLIRSQKVMASNWSLPWNPSTSTNVLQDDFSKLQDHMVNVMAKRLADALTSCLSTDVLAVYVTAADLESPPTLGVCRRLVSTLTHELGLDADTEDGPPTNPWDLLEEIWDQDEVKWETMRLSTALSTTTADLETWSRFGGRRSWQHRMVFAITLSGWMRFTDHLTKANDFTDETLFVFTASCLHLLLETVQSMKDSNVKRCRFVLERLFGFIMQIVETNAVSLTGWLKEKMNMLRQTLRQWTKDS